MASSTVSSKGQITIPIEIRNRLGLREGDRVEFVVEGARTTLRPMRHERDDRFGEFAGVLDSFSSLDEIVAWQRDLRDDANEQQTK